MRAGSLVREAARCAFAGRAPAPGGRFTQAEFAQTPWGPVLAGERSWAGLRLESGVEVGWSLLFTGTVEHVEVFDEAQMLTTAQKLQACTNLGVGNPEHDFAADYAAAKA